MSIYFGDENDEELEKYFQGKDSYSSFDLDYSEEKENNQINNHNNLDDTIKNENTVFNENNLGSSRINGYSSLISSDLKNITFGNTQSTTKVFLNKKRKLEKNEKGYIDTISIKEEKKDIKIINNDNNIRLGRRRKDKIYHSEPKHDKFKEDNIIRKIKTLAFSFTLDYLNNSLEKKGNNRFYPLDTFINENLKKDFNEALLKKTICEIYNNSDLNKRFKHINDSNRILIKKIFDEKKEIKTIKILKMKFEEILNYIKENDIENFLGEIEKKEKRNKGKLIGIYMVKVKDLLNNYKGWFTKKKGRNVTKKKYLKLKTFVNNYK